MNVPEWIVEVDALPLLGFGSVDELLAWFAGGQTNALPPRIIFTTLPVRGRFAVILDGNERIGEWAWVTRTAASTPAAASAEDRVEDLGPFVTRLG